MHIDSFENKRVLIMGLGQFGGGLDAAMFAAERGANVIITDLADIEKLRDSMEKLQKYPNIEYHLGGHLEKDFEQTDILIVNPAVPNENKYVQAALQKNVYVTSQISIFFDLCPAKIIGITGSNGKSTTASLTAHLLRAEKNRNYGNVSLSGNIGNAPLLMLLAQIKPDDLAVLELSSFQIEQLALHKQAPQIALVTNLLPNHLDRYGTFEKYCQAKEYLFRLQKLDEALPAFSIFNTENDITLGWYEKYKNDNGRKCLMFSADDINDSIISSFSLPGRINLSNLAAARSIARCFDISDDSIEKSIGSFKALANRLEFAAEINGVKWYNDSKATTPESTMAAIEAFDKPVILIAGGYDKHLPFDELGILIARKVKKTFLIGQTASKIEKAVENTGNNNTYICNSLEQAVESAAKIASKGDVVVLSPACASYDMFENYEHRGRVFCRLVNDLTKKL